jgi:hypothetical protein
VVAFALASALLKHVPELTIEQIVSIQETLRAEISQRQELLRAYDLVRQHISSRTPAVAVPASPNGTHSVAAPRENTTDAYHTTVKPEYGRNTRLVREAIEEYGDEAFTIREISEKLTERGTPISVDGVTTVMNRLKDGTTPFVKIVQHGIGRHPNIFVKA